MVPLPAGPTGTSPRPPVRWAPRPCDARAPEEDQMGTQWWRAGHPRGARRATGVWLTCICALLAAGVSTAPAGGITFSQQTLPFVGLASPRAVAVDRAGDVFTTDTGNGRVVELPAGSTQQTVLPLTGFSGAQGVAIDQAGDVFVADSFNARVVELP